MHTNYFYEFGSFRLYPATNQLLSDGQSVSLPPKVFETLLILVQRSGQVVDKGEFMKILWPNAFVEESNLSQNIFTLRKILGTRTDGKQYVQTVPKRGYRFISDVRKLPGPGINPGMDQSTGSQLVLPVEERYRKDIIISSLAILPLMNVGGDLRLEYLSDGLTEFITNFLSRISGLHVMACSTMHCYKGQEVDPQEVGRKLGVEAVAVGRIRQLDNNLTIAMELVDVACGWQLWGEQYHHKISDMFDLQKPLD